MNNFKKIKKEITNFRNDAEKDKEQKEKLSIERVERDKILLENFGVRELFESIRDSGLVITSQLLNKSGLIKKFFGGIDYIPAKIESNTRNIEGNNSIYIRLSFNADPALYMTSFGMRMHDWGHDYVEFSIVDGELCFTDHSKIDSEGYVTIQYVPVGSRDLNEFIVEEIKRCIRNRC